VGGGVSVVFGLGVRRNATVLIISVLLSIAVLGTWGYLCVISDDALPFSDRATGVTNGVCPSLPILLIAAGLYAWAIGSLRRITYFQNRAARFPVSHFDLVVKSDFEVLREDLEKTLSPVSLPTTGTVWCIVSAIFCLLLYRWVGLDSLEPTVFSYRRVAPLGHRAVQHHKAHEHLGGAQENAQTSRTTPDSLRFQPDSQHLFLGPHLAARGLPKIISRSGQIA